jgi:indolepyruvate ferredoxin oxidoreductase alpha subunit
MTGFQPHPGTGLSGMGNPSPQINIVDVARGVGVKSVISIDPFDPQAAIRALRGALKIVQEKKEVVVAVSRRECAILTIRRKRRDNIPIIPWEVDSKKCTGCKTCLEQFACPAISMEEKKAVIDPIICLDCGVCAKICSYHAIERKKHETI